MRECLRHTFLVTTLFILPLNVLADSTVSVQVKSSKIRSAPQYWATAVATVVNGDSLTKIGKEEEGWVKVKNRAGVEGFIPEASVTVKGTTLSSLASPGSYSAQQSDVVLAGKGFSKETERDFSTSRTDLNFTAVNAMERISVSDSDLKSFIDKGGLGKKNG